MSAVAVTCCDCASFISLAREFSQTLPRFSISYGGTDNMFYFFYKIIIFNVKKDNDDIRSANCKTRSFKVIFGS